MSAPSQPQRAYAYRQPIDEEKLRKQRIYYAYRGKEEQEKQPWFPGNIFDVRYGDEPLGEAQVILVEALRLQDLTEYDAILTGFPDEDELRKAVAQWLDFDPEDEKQGFYKILHRWL